MTSERPSLATAFLALLDEPAPAAPRRSVARAAVALVAVVALPFAGPLAWSAAAEGRLADQPVAVQSGAKASPFEADDDEGDA